MSKVERLRALAAKLGEARAGVDAADDGLRAARVAVRLAEDELLKAAGMRDVSERCGTTWSSKDGVRFGRGEALSLVTFGLWVVDEEPSEASLLEEALRPGANRKLVMWDESGKLLRVVVNPAEEDWEGWALEDVSWKLVEAADVSGGVEVKSE